MPPQSRTVANVCRKLEGNHLTDEVEGRWHSSVGLTPDVTIPDGAAAAFVRTMTAALSPAICHANLLELAYENIHFPHDRTLNQLSEICTEMLCFGSWNAVTGDSPLVIPTSSAGADVRLAD